MVIHFYTKNNKFDVIQINMHQVHVMYSDLD